MPEYLTTLTDNHIVINNAKEANDDTARQNSISFNSKLKAVEPVYTRFRESLKGTKGVTAKVNNYIEQNILVSGDLKGKTAVKWVKSQLSFEVLEGKGLLSQIKNTLSNITSDRKIREAAANAKHSRVTLAVRPEKYFEKSSDPGCTSGRLLVTNAALITAMSETKDAYYAALGDLSEKERMAKTRTIRDQLVETLQNDGYTFIQEVNGMITQLSDDEAGAWIAGIYKKYKKSQHKFEEAQPAIIRSFTSAEDMQIIQFVQRSIAAGFPFKHVPHGDLADQMPDRDKESIRQRVKYLYDENGDLQPRLNNGNDWTEAEDRILFDSKMTGVPDFKALSQQLERSERAIKKRIGEVTFEPSGKRVKRKDVMQIILSDQLKSKEYLSTAKTKPHDQLSERSQVMGCQEHAYKGNMGYSTGVPTEIVGGLKVTGPPLHQAAATVGSGPKPSTTGKRKGRMEASHKCKNSRCVNSEHLVWEETCANTHRISCVGMIKFRIGGKDVMVRAKECTCNGHCLDYVTAA